MIITNGDTIESTDYFNSTERMKRLAWLYIESTKWHLMIPEKFSPRIQWAQVLPVPDEDEPDGWKWRLELQDQCYDLPLPQITGKRPPLPDQGVVQRRQCLLYNAYYPSVGPWFFGSVEKGMQHKACTLFVCHGVKMSNSDRYV